MKKFISMMLSICMVCIVFTGCGVNQEEYDKVASERDNLLKQIEELNNNREKTNDTVVSEKQTTTAPKGDEDIPYEIHKTNTGSIVIKAVNNTSEIKRIKVEATFYKDKQMLSVADETLYAVAPKQQFVCRLIKPCDDNLKTVPFDDVKINITSELDKSYTSVIDKVKLQHNKGAKDIIIKATNTSDKEIDFLNCQVLFYKGKDIVGCSSVTEMFIKPNSTASITAYIPYDLNSDNINFDKYEVLITRATV